MKFPHRPSYLVKAQLEAFRATLPSGEIKIPENDPAAELQMQFWKDHEAELEAELREALNAEVEAEKAEQYKHWRPQKSGIGVGSTVIGVGSTVLEMVKNQFSMDIGINLGSEHCLFLVSNKGIVSREPSVVAIEAGTTNVLAVGEEANRMLGRTPRNIVAIRPMKDGVIADFEITEAMLRHFIQKVNQRKLIAPRVVVAVPSGITEVEKRAVKDSATHAGAREVHFIEKTMASAIGVGLPVHEPVGNVIVDIGGGTCDMAIISLAGIVFSRSLRVGGDEFDETIIAHMKRAYNLMIGERTAEEIKIRIGSAFPLEQELTLEVKGRDLDAGLPKTLTISSEEIREALKEPLNSILESIRITLERCPPELSADLVDRGIVMAGGGALLRGIDRMVAQETGLPVRIADNPLDTVAAGTVLVLHESRLLKQISAGD